MIARILAIGDIHGCGIALDVWLRWQALTGEEIRHCSGKTVICGYSALANGLPAYADGIICIDTKSYAGQWLTCLDVTKDRDGSKAMECITGGSDRSTALRRCNK